MSTTADDVLASLEWRLNRLEHVLTGSNASEPIFADTVVSVLPSIPLRLAALDRRLSNLIRESPVIADVLQLSMWAQIDVLLSTYFLTHHPQTRPFQSR